MRHSSQFIYSITSGAQKWNGATQAFMNKDNDIIIFMVSGIQFFVRIGSKRVIEIEACIGMYFNAAFVARCLLVFEIKDTNANKMISCPIKDTN